MRTKLNLLVPLLAAVLAVSAYAAEAKKPSRSMKKTCLSECRKNQDAGLKACRKKTGAEKSACGAKAAAKAKKCKAACAAK